MIFGKSKAQKETECGKAWWRDFSWEDCNRYVMYPTAAQRIAEMPAKPTASLVPLECQKCGAPMKNVYKCEYCGTRYGPALQPTLYGKPIDDGTAVMEDQLKETARKVALTIDEDVESQFAEILSASQKFKSLGLLSS